ncbi:MAG: choice-of-anchor B family protein [Planctomycetes bacterium]|nr:choice-of-anchor B family protein [Planctomycetota bacterium]
MTQYRLSVSISALVVLAALAHAQNLNTRLVGSANKFPGAVTPTNNYAGVWGIVGRNGKEYAIVPARTGTVIYDCSNPATPVERGFIAGPGSTSQPYFWREANSYGDYVYISSEHGPLQVINMTNPDAPALAGTFGTTAHTVSVDPGTGVLWASGGGPRGCVLFNVAANPIAPAELRRYTTDYVHDCLPIRGYAYLAQIFSGNMRILSTANIGSGLPIVSTTTTPGRFTHNVWVTDDDKLAVTADENQGGCLTVYDISNKAAPVQRSTWCSPNGATVHNVFIKGKVAHFSSYSDGYWAIDISKPTSPKPVARFDTNALTGSDYHGCWGCYPFQPSGLIYLTDMQTGFFIVEVTAGVPNHYGKGTAGTGGLVPTIDYAGGFAQVGNGTFAIEGTQMRGGSSAALILGVAATNQSVLGIDLLVDLGQPNVVFTSATGGNGGVAGSGSANIPVPLPNTPGIAGATLYAQYVVADPTNPAGLSASRGMKVTIAQ